MQDLLPTVVYRHRRENLKKCSLRGLEQRADFRFYTYPKTELPAVEGYVLLDLEGEPLSEKDRNKGLLVLDGTWRLAGQMKKHLEGKWGALPKRSIPSSYMTAYPRRQEDCADPERGLASVEAIYVALGLMGREVAGVLDHYYWKEDFLKLNKWMEL